jgi:hypothetical protein
MEQEWRDNHYKHKGVSSNLFVYMRTYSDNDFRKYYAVIIVNRTRQNAQFDAQIRKVLSVKYAFSTPLLVIFAALLIV